jgi:hypothetical protein
MVRASNTKHTVNQTGAAFVELVESFTEVQMVRHQRVGTDCCTGTCRKGAHATQKLSPVLIISKYSTSLYPPDNHMMQGARRIKSRSSRHFSSSDILLTEYVQ